MEELEKSLAKIVNESQLPLEVIRYVLKHLYQVVNLNYQLALEKEKTTSEKQNDQSGTDTEN